MEFLTTIILIVMFSALAFWKGNPVIFLIIAGLSMMSGLYAPDALKELTADYNTYSSFGVGIGLMLIIYSFVCIALAYANLFQERN